MNDKNTVTLPAPEISTNQKQFICDICQKEFLTKVHYQVHSFIHLFSEPPNCDECHEDLTHILNLDKHLAVHTSEQCISCHICKKEFSDIDSFNEHAEKHNGESTSIVKGEPDNENAARKMLENGNYSPCDDRNSSNKFDIHQLDEPQQNICIKQEMDSDEFVELEFVVDNSHAAVKNEFFPSDSLGEIENNTSSQSSQICESVKSSTMEAKERQDTNLNATHQNSKKLKQFICIVCQKMFKNKHSLTVHSLSHSDEKIYSCDICGKKFALKCLLNAHIRTHKERQFLCGVCQKGFASKDKLFNHVYVHAVVASFSCNICKMTFPEKSLLEEHHLIHTVKKEFICEVSQEKYSSEKALDNHMHAHSKLPESFKSNFKNHSSDENRVSYVNVRCAKKSFHRRMR